MIANFLRTLPSFKGKNRISKLLLNNFINTAEDVQVKTKNGCNFLLPNIKENVGFDLYINGEYEPETIWLLLTKASSDKVFLDIGANIGSVSIPLAKAKPEMKVISVEASSRMSSYLKQNIVLNGLTNIQVVERAVSDKANQSVSFFSPKEKYGKGSLSPVFTSEAENVLTVTLDELFELSNCKLGLIKIDIEGYEYFAFAGGQSVLSAPDAPDIYFEFNDWCEQAAGLPRGSSQEKLVQYGYSLYEHIGGRLEKLDGVIRTGSRMLFATKSKIS